MATTKGYRYTFDAWDRLVTVKDTSDNLVAEYRYTVCARAQRSHTGSQVARSRATVSCSRIGWHYDENASGTTDSSDDWFYFQYTVCTGAQRTCTGSR